MLKIILAALLLFQMLFSSGSNIFLSSSGKRADSGTLEKMIVADGSVTIDLDLNQLTGTPSKGLRSSVLRFDAAADSFFTILVYNGELRAALPGTLALVSKTTARLPSALSGLNGNLVVERTAFASDHALIVRDGKTGFVYFNIQGQTTTYDANQRVFVSQGGKMLVSKEFAEQLGRPSAEGSVAGQLSINANMRAIEISEVVNGEVVSNGMPANAGTVPGPDVVVGSLFDLSQWGTDATHVGLAVGTDSCNYGTENLHWFANPANDHPVIPQNLYRMSGGATNDERFEQIGQSSVKHAFTALTLDICNLGCNGVGSNNLGSGCSDPYDASLNEGPNLGSRAWINPFTGAFPRNDVADPNQRNNSHTGHNHTSGPLHRILTPISDLNTTLNAGATYYAEAQYITPHEYAWCQANPTQCNMYNNVSYRRFNVAGTSSFTFSPAATTERMKPAINAWTGAASVEIRPEPGVDGVARVAYKVTNPSPGVWHYEYAVYNENLDRAVQSFSIPAGAGVTINNIGFHAPPQHPGWSADGTVGNTGYSNAPWTQSQTGGLMTWSSETLAQNANANAIRWGTMYNFRFDSNRPPATMNATVGFFKTGPPINVQVQGPSSTAASNAAVSGRVTAQNGRGIGHARVSINGTGVNRTAITNSFGYYSFQNIPTGTSYNISASAKLSAFTPQNLFISDNVGDVNFVALP